MTATRHRGPTVALPGSKIPLSSTPDEWGRYDLHIRCNCCRWPLLTWIGYLAHMSEWHPGADWLSDPRPARKRKASHGLVRDEA